MREKKQNSEHIHTEVNEHLAKALPHVLRHCQDTGDIVVEERILLLEVIKQKYITVASECKYIIYTIYNSYTPKI